MRMRLKQECTANSAVSVVKSAAPPLSPLLPGETVSFLLERAHQSKLENRRAKMPCSHSVHAISRCFTLFHAILWGGEGVTRFASFVFPPDSEFRTQNSKLAARPRDLSSLNAQFAPPSFPAGNRKSKIEAQKLPQTHETHHKITETRGNTRNFFNPRTRSKNSIRNVSVSQTRNIFSRL